MDSKKDHMDKKIVSSFQGQERNAPAGLWSGIENSIGLSTDEAAIKNSFSNIQKQAPKKGWSTVKRQLIIDEVWSNILAIQERRRRRAIIWWWSGSLGTLLLIFGLWWMSTNDVLQSNETQIAAVLEETQKEGSKLQGVNLFTVNCHHCEDSSPLFWQNLPNTSNFQRLNVFNKFCWSC